MTRCTGAVGTLVPASMKSNSVRNETPCSRAYISALKQNVHARANCMLALTSTFDNNPNKSSTNSRKQHAAARLFGGLTRVFAWMEVLSSFPSSHPAQSTCARCRDSGEWVPPINSRQHRAARCSTSDFQSPAQLLFRFSQYRNAIPEAVDFLDAINSTT